MREGFSDLETVKKLYEKGLVSWEEFLELRNRAKSKGTGSWVLGTGVSVLDELLDGGVRRGSVVSLTSGHLAMPEVFLYRMLGMGETMYFSFDRGANQVQNEVQRYGVSLSEVEFKDIYSQYYRDERGKFRFNEEFEDRQVFELVQSVLERIEERGEAVNLVFDSVTFFQELEVPRKDILSLFNYVYDVVKNIGGVAVLVNYARYSEGFVSAVENMCDVVIRMDMVNQEGVGVERYLSVPKVRNGVPSDRVVRYQVGRGGEVVVLDESVTRVSGEEEEAGNGFRLVSGFEGGKELFADGREFIRLV